MKKMVSEYQRETIGTAVCNLYLRLEMVIMTRCFRRFRAAKRELLIRSCLQIWCRLRVFSWGSSLDLEFPRIVLSGILCKETALKIA